MQRPLWNTASQIKDFAIDPHSVYTILCIQLKYYSINGYNKVFLWNVCDKKRRSVNPCHNGSPWSAVTHLLAALWFLKCSCCQTLHASNMDAANQGSRNPVRIHLLTNALVFAYCIKMPFCLTSIDCIVSPNQRHFQRHLQKKTFENIVSKPN